MRLSERFRHALFIADKLCLGDKHALCDELKRIEDEVKSIENEAAEIARGLNQFDRGDRLQAQYEAFALVRKLAEGRN